MRLSSMECALLRQVSCSISVVTPLTNGNTSRQKRVICTPSQSIILAIAIKSQTGTSFERLPTSIGIKPKPRWLNCGMAILVSGPSHEPSRKLDLLEKKTYGYRERDEHKRTEFIKRLSTVAPDDIVYADESGMDNRDEYDYAYGPKGERVYALKTGRRSGRVNMIAALRAKQLMAPFTIEGACNRTVFEIWLERCLIPLLKPGQKLVIDNATFHKGGRIQELVEAAGCDVWYLPPYSPDLNKIERSWSWIKSRIRHQLDYCGSLREAMEHVLQLAS